MVYLTDNEAVTYLNRQSALNGLGNVEATKKTFPDTTLYNQAEEDSDAYAEETPVVLNTEQEFALPKSCISDDCSQPECSRWPVLLGMLAFGFGWYFLAPMLAGNKK